MTTYTTRPDETTVDTQPREVRERTSPVLLGALAVALVALGVWWYSAQREASPVADTTPILIEPAAGPSSTPAQQARDARATAARSERRAVPAIADRSARPLAGNPLPDYPRTALRNGQEGSVLLSIAVDASGVPTDVQVVRRTGDRDREFDRAAIEAARQWRFEPAMRGGKAVSSTVQLPIDFRRG